MKKILFFLTAACCVVASCTKDKTDYEAEKDREVTEHLEFKEATAFQIGEFAVSIEALNGSFYKGYNEIRLKIRNSRTDQAVSSAVVTWLPVLSGPDGSMDSGPHRHWLVAVPDDGYYSGYTVFTSESTAEKVWELYISFTIAGQTYDITKTVIVQEQTNRNLSMTAFTGRDDEQYFIALVAPQKPQVAENQLVAGIYRYNRPGSPPSGNFPDPAQFSYSEVGGYSLLLDPRMPEPSMGNHSSPNNQDLTPQSDGLYYGIVNYTMTGNWTLNFILLDQQGQIVKGSPVPEEFTPGVEGIKSELYIDILF